MRIQGGDQSGRVVPRIALVDYGVGNLHSVHKAFERVGARVTRTSSAVEIADADCVVVPGVGAFGDGMRGLQERNLIEPLQKYATTGRPLFGICLGMQLFFDRSEEFGNERGLGIIPGDVVAIPRTTGVKVPHMGWNDLSPTRGSFDGTPLEGLAVGAYVYFCHSFVPKPKDPTHTLAVTTYGDSQLSVGAAKGNVWGTQFHPEKSGPVGLGLLRRFVDKLSRGGSQGAACRNDSPFASAEG